MAVVLRLLPILLLVLFTTALALFGWFNPVEFPDTVSYVAAAALSNPWGEARHPLYGWFLKALSDFGIGIAFIPAIQFFIHVVAVIALLYAAISYGLDRFAAFAIGGAVIFNQCLVIWGHAVLPEMPSVSLLVLSFATIILAIKNRWFWPMALLFGISLGLSYILRPIMLPAVVVLPILFGILSKMATKEWRFGRMLLLIVLAVTPFIAQSAYRYQKVGDFNIVSFGGFGVTGMTAQLLTPDVVDRLPEVHQPLAKQLLEAKQKGIDEQIVMPLFRNSVGQRSFQTTALDGFDALSRNFDEIMWGQAVKLKKTDESWVAFNARMGALNGAILRSLPERWALWVVGASARLVGRLMTYNVTFLLACAAFGLVAITNALRSGSALAGGAGESWTPLVLIVAAWVLCTTPLTVLAAFPALRYIDTGGIMLAALPLYGLFLAVRKTRSVAPM
jgi:hypothetical protein